MHRPPGLVVTLALTVALGLSGCGDSDDQTDDTTPPAETTAAPEATVAPATTAPSAAPALDDGPLDLGRVVVIGEEFLLADVLALGGQPVAATATLEDRFVGIERDTSAIEPFSPIEPNFERLAAFQPDLIITTTGVASFVGEEIFEEIAETAIVDNSDWRAQVTQLGEAMGVPERAEALLASYDDAVAAASGQIPTDLRVTVATVYVGPSVAAWTDGPVNIPAVLLDLGITLTPGAGELDGESNGRVYLSEELITELDGDLLVLAQTAGVEGEDAALAEVAEGELWQGLPAVAADNTLTVDRLGYPGVEGRIRLIDDVLAALG